MGLQKNFKLTEVSFFIKVMLSLHFCPPPSGITKIKRDIVFAASLYL